MPLSESALEPLLRLALVPGVGPGRLAVLVRRFGSAERVFAAAPHEVGALPGFGPELVRRLRTAHSGEADQRARQALRALQRVDGFALTPDDLAYPASFAALPDRPFLLFATGQLELLRRPGIAVVGTRTPTPGGREAAAMLSRDLARAGYSVVSGMAKGIDAAAHTAALDAGGATVGVLGHGVDQVYPPENRHLFNRMREQALLVSEFVPTEKPRAGNFPRRNRLITALSEGVLVVEMALRSGAQHTVGFALEQGKEVFAVPGPIGSAVSAGTNQLIKDGARVVTAAADVLEELRGVGEPERSRPAPTAVQAAAPLAAAAVNPMPDGLGADEAAVFPLLTAEPRHVDDLALVSGRGTGAVLGALLGLELRGLAESLPGKWFRRGSG